MYMGQDSICPVAKTQKIAEQIKSNDGSVVLENREHEFAAGANDQEFMKALKGLLGNSGEKMSKTACKWDFRWN